jgi:RimJ/RimL family protein N-acetyltransferase
VSGDISIRRATHGDLDFLVEVLNDDDVRPFLAAGRELTREALEVELNGGDERGRFVVEVDGERAGTLAFERRNVRSRIAHLGGLAIHPRFRGRRVADEAARLFQRHLLFDLGFHRLEMTVYGFNERAQAHAERAGWIKEGVKRKAYVHGDGWTDGVMFGLIREDLEEG